MEFEGVVYKIMPVTRGTSARGEWQRQDVVFDYNDGGQFSRKICVTFFNKESDVAKLREGETFLVSVNIESREYNGRWYTDIRAWRVQPKQQQPPVPMTDAPLPSDIPAEGGSFGGGAAAEVDDLPFCGGGGGIYNGRRAEFSSNSARRPFRVPLRQFVRRVGMRAAVISLSCCRRYRMSRQSPSFRRCCSGSRP